MIIIRVELHSAISHRVTELARMKICNVGGTGTRGDYEAEVFRGRDKASLDKERVQRKGEVKNYPREAIHVFNLVARALNTLGYK